MHLIDDGFLQIILGLLFLSNLHQFLQLDVDQKLNQIKYEARQVILILTILFYLGICLAELGNMYFFGDLELLL